MIDLNGEWIGFYKYGEGYSDANKRLTVQFVMVIEEGIADFIGKIYEDETNGGFKDSSIVRGKLLNDEINFVKFYLNANYINSDSSKETFDCDNFSKVYYKGRYYFDENKFKGEWFIEDYIFDNEGILHDTILRGEWEILKKII